MKYCGTNTLPKWLNSFLSFFHNDACMVHDYQYESKISRVLADIIFLKNMIINSLKSLIIGCVQIALIPIMFFAVLFFGYKFYNK